jgi:predicted metal-dependent hydrolase
VREQNVFIIKMTTTVNHPVLGDITISKTKRARRITLSVRPSGVVRLSIPPWVSTKEGMRFVDSKAQWVQAALTRYAEKNPAEVIEMPYSTRTHHLELFPGNADAISVRIKDGVIRVSYPLEEDYRDPEVQAAIKKGILEAWRAEAKSYLPERVAALASKHGFKAGKVSVRNTVSKWGSCSPRNDISLSLHLMRLPDHLIDYIILHELCHTVHKNHGPRFHALLDEHTGGRHKSLNKELRSYNTRW